MDMTRTPPRSGEHHAAPIDAELADRAYRHAWWSLALYPVAFVGGFAVGEGLFSLLGGTEQGAPAPLWVVLVAATSALLVMCVPGVVAWRLGRRATRFGRRDGWVPGVVGVVVTLGVFGVNALAFVVGTLLD
jgi:hypothetical protein